MEFTSGALLAILRQELEVRERTCEECSQDIPHKVRCTGRRGRRPWSVMPGRPVQCPFYRGIMDLRVWIAELEKEV